MNNLKIIIKVKKIKNIPNSFNNLLKLLEPSSRLKIQTFYGTFLGSHYNLLYLRSR